jgi:hypothetical protein
MPTDSGLDCDQMLLSTGSGGSGATAESPPQEANRIVIRTRLKCLSLIKSSYIFIFSLSIKYGLCLAQYLPEIALKLL